MTNEETLNNLLVDDLTMKLGEHLCNQTIDILKIVAILMGINRDDVNAKSKWYVKKIIEKIYEDVLEDNSEQDYKKICLIGIINEVTTIMPKPDNKQLNTSEDKDDTDPDKRMKENRNVVNDGDKESDIQAGKAVADNDQEGKDKMNILQELGVLRKTSLLRKEFRVRGVIGRLVKKKNSSMYPLCTR